MTKFMFSNLQCYKLLKFRPIFSLQENMWGALYIDEYGRQFESRSNAAPMLPMLLAVRVRVH